MTTTILRFIYNSIRPLLALAASLAVASCGGGGGAGVPAEPDAPEDVMVNLTFDVTVPDGGGSSSPSRAASVVTTPDGDNYFEPGIEPYEQIHTLRVIILRPEKIKAEDGTLTETGQQVVEVNRYFTFNNVGVVLYDNLQFEVVGGEKKSIYLLANEARVAASQPKGFTFESLIPGTPYTPGTIEDLTISADPVTNILIDNTPSSTAKAYLPMSEVYHDIDIKMPVTTDLRTQSIGTLFITRTPVKFTFTVTVVDKDKNPVTIPDFYLKDITVNSLADKEYYLPRNTIYDPAKGEPGVTNGSSAPYPTLSGHFITSYDIPDGVINYTHTFSLPAATELKATSLSLPLYFCETKLPAGSATGPYTVSITTGDTANPGVFQTYDPIPLPNLPILPRNTHVKVNITISTEAEVNMTVDLVPYIGINLDPIFGL